MADITDPNALEHPSPGDDLTGNGLESRGTKRPRMSAAGDDDDDDDEKGGRERRKIEIKFIQDKSRRHITFSKRKAGIMKKVRLPIVIAHTRQHLLTITLTHRLTNSPSSPVLRSFFSSSQRLVSSTRSQHQSYNHWSRSQKAKISFK